MNGLIRMGSAGRNMVTEKGKNREVRKGGAEGAKRETGTEREKENALKCPG
jgi:hypothetical protein